MASDSYSKLSVSDTIGNTDSAWRRDGRASALADGCAEDRRYSKLTVIAMAFVLTKLVNNVRCL